MAYRESIRMWKNDLPLIMKQMAVVQTTSAKMYVFTANILINYVIFSMSGEFYAIGRIVLYY